MNELQSINKSLTVISLIILFLAKGMGNVFSDIVSSLSPSLSFTATFCMVAAAIILIPLFIWWTKLLWNNIIPRITSLRRITFWESAALVALVMILSL